MNSFTIRDPRRLLCRALLALALAIAGSSAFAASVAQQNLVDLIEESNAIVVGTVSKVTDGFTDQGVPYTEVTLKVSERILGAPANHAANNSAAGEADTYTFRQFGLMKPRTMGGRTYLGVTPDGWPNWSKREHVLVFMNAPARLTGLQTTVGLNQGKLQWSDGRLMNAENNAGMFQHMKITARDLSQAQTAMLSGQQGKPIDAQPFVELVRRAVDENWIARGVMRHEK
jgi:hypothetical protein